MAADPHAAKPLRDELEGLRSRALGRTRIVIRIRRDTVEIVAIGHRRDIYERVAGELSAAVRRNRPGEFIAPSEATFHTRLAIRHGFLRAPSRGGRAGKASP